MHYNYAEEYNVESQDTMLTFNVTPTSISYITLKKIESHVSFVMSTTVCWSTFIPYSRLYCRDSLGRGGILWLDTAYPR